MPAKKQSAVTEKVALYDALIATIPAIERKGDANPYTSLNGNMFTLLHQGRLAIRLPEDEREKFLKKHKTTLFEAYGAVMQEYVAVPDEMLANTKELQKYLAVSYAYAQTLKPKPARRKSIEPQPFQLQKKAFNASIRTCSFAIATPIRCMFPI
jgi:TfoX/Sxy family transcriptional regulator of competence genes